MPATATARVGDPDCRPFPGCRLSASRGTGEPTTRILGCSGVSGVRAGDGLSRSSAHEALTKSGTRENKVAMQVASPTADQGVVEGTAGAERRGQQIRHGRGEDRTENDDRGGGPAPRRSRTPWGWPARRRPRSPAAKREKLDGQGIGGSQPGEQHDATPKSVRPPDGPGEKGRDSSRCRRPSDSRPRRGRRRLRRGIHFASFLNT